MNRFNHLVAVLALPMAWPAMSPAATLVARLDGVRLAINGPCAASVLISGVSGSGITVRATAQHAEEIASLVLVAQNGAAVVRRREAAGGCWQPPGSTNWSPTLTLAVGVPRTMPIAIDDRGSADYRISGVGGSLAISLAGAVTLRADRTTSIDGRLAGANRVAVARMDGPTVSLEMSGHSVVAVDSVAAEEMRIRSAGTGNVNFASGHVSALSVMSTGGGAITFGGTIGNGSVSLIGEGIVRLARINGTLNRQVIGSGTIAVGKHRDGR